MIIHHLRSMSGSLFEFLRPSHEYGGTSPAGYPHMDLWRSNDNPYDRLLGSVQVKTEAQPLYALIFLHKEERGRAIYLGEGKHSLGNGCLNEIVVSSSTRADCLCDLLVDRSGVVVSNRSVGVSLGINSNILSSGQMIEQDVCEIDSISFTIVKLGGV